MKKYSVCVQSSGDHQNETKAPDLKFVISLVNKEQHIESPSNCHSNNTILICMHYANTIPYNLLATVQKVYSQSKSLGMGSRHSQVTFNEVSQHTHD